ncbi:MAG: GNAT family N-acetyltransferase [Phycisphaerales bacterium]
MQKAIIADSHLCGSIGVRIVDGVHAVGYGLGRAHWGRGIASRALELLLAEVAVRPLHARAAASNPASIRVLLKNGFVITGRGLSPETDRYIACEEVQFLRA